MLATPSAHMPVSVYGYKIKKGVSISSSISRYIPDGEYELHVAYLPQNDFLWTYCDRIYCEDYIWWAAFKPLVILMNISEGIITIQDMEGFTGADIPWTNGIHSIMADSPQTDEVYDLCGRRTLMNKKGLFIIRKNGKIVKTTK